MITMGQIYLDLLRTGNILFSKWTATVYCGPAEFNTIKVNFGISKENKSIVGMRKLEKSTLTSLQKTNSYLHRCYEEWVRHANEKRDQYSELNYFQINQIVHLRKIISKLIKCDFELSLREASTDGDWFIMNSLFDLLYNVNRSCTVRMLKEASAHAKKQCEQAIVEKIQNNDIDEDSEESKCQKKKEIMSGSSANESQIKIPVNVLNQLQESGFSTKLIYRAANVLKSAEINKLLEYCLENEMNKDIDVIKLQLKDSDPLHSVGTNSNMADLEGNYNQIWHKFISYLEMNFEEFISLDYLGSMLNYLKAKSNETINRNKPLYLDYNVPNLIVCPRDEIISRTLSIYALSPEQPLPSDDEILYCNSDTTHEQVELFWRRVLNEPLIPNKNQDSQQQQKKIYCLINIQELAYDQAMKAHSAFEKLISVQNYSSLIQKTQQLQLKNYEQEPNTATDSGVSTTGFLLCILCSQEKEDKSIFSTAFSRYRKNVPLERQLNESIMSYLGEKFKLQGHHNMGKYSLSRIEKDGLTCRIITSDQAGCGKSLYVKRLLERARSQLPTASIEHYCIPIKKQTVPHENVFRALRDSCKNSKSKTTTAAAVGKLYHIDIAYEVWHGVDHFLFSLLCLGILQNSRGHVWRRSIDDLYLIEIMAPRVLGQENRTVGGEVNNSKPLHSILSVLPTLICLSPLKVLNFVRTHEPLPAHVCPLLFDEQTLKSELIQRPTQYLQALESANVDLDHFSYNNARFLNVRVCLELLLKHSEIEQPSWFELVNFSSFLNTQLIDCEKSVYCDTALMGEDLPGFKSFVVRFMIQMSHDFALPSLDTSNQSALRLNTSGDEALFDLEQMQLRRKWENSPHPYLFFNPDGHTFTFFGFYVRRHTGELIDPNTEQTLFTNNLVLSRQLMHGISHQARNVLNERISEMTKLEKIKKLMSVMGIESKGGFGASNQIKDPDPSYELTMDNLLKMLAIYMRLRANIPVIIMGETGCGKTRLIKYMCDLYKSPYESTGHHEVKNMYLVKAHGGTTSEEIINVSDTFFFKLI
jgi:E3 ubiquitin-protein ligase RNF213